jgi:hypothetical protein
MKTVPLRELLRQPVKIKRWTHAGQTVQVNDNGKPLWIIKPACGTADDEQKRRASIEKMFTEISKEPIAPMSLSKIVKDSRR